MADTLSYAEEAGMDCYILGMRDGARKVFHALAEIQDEALRGNPPFSTRHFTSRMVSRAGDIATSYDRQEIIVRAQDLLKEAMRRSGVEVEMTLRSCEGEGAD